MKNKLHNEENYKLFIDTWRLLHTNTRMFEYWMKNGEFSIHERRLLRCFQFYKKNKKKECLDLLEAKINDDTFLEGVRLYLKGLVYNQHCHYFYAIENLEKSIELFQSINEERFQLNSLCLIVMVYGNRREIKNMASTLDQIKEFTLETNSQKLQLLYAELFYFVLTNNKEAVLAACKKALSLKYPEYEGFHAYFLVQKFMLFAKNEEYKACYQILEDYKKLSGNLVKANYAYMKTLLDHLDQDAPLYVYARDYGEFPELYQQLEVIKSLKEGNLEGAKKFWKKLSQHNPSLYGEDFEFKGDHTLFAQGLKRYLVHRHEVKLDQTQIDAISSALDKLIFILANSARPLETSELIMVIWKEDYSVAALGRLRKLVSRYNQNSDNKIVASRGTYQLASSAPKSA